VFLKSATKFELGKGFINLSLAFFVFSIIQPVVKEEVSLNAFGFGVLGFITSGAIGIMLLEAGGNADGD